MTQQRDSGPESIARWLRESRRAAKFSNAHKLLAAMAEAGLKPPSYGSYGQWESGAVQPREESLASLRAFYAERLGIPTTPEPQPDLAAALMALAGELTAAREERARYLALEGTVKALEETVAGLLRSNRKAGGSGASRAGRAPQGSAG